MSRAGTLGRTLLAVPLLLALFVLPAGRADGDTSRAVPALGRGLLTLADLPAGYAPWKPEYKPYSASTSPECAAVLDELEFSRPRYRGVDYAFAGFAAKGAFGPWVVENLRRYPTAVVADHDLDRVLRVLPRCSSFSLAYRGERPAVSVVRVTPIRMAALGDRSRAMWITVNVNGEWAYGEVLVLARVRSTLMVLSQLAFRPPKAAAAQAVAARAVARLRAAKV
ncbi:hypothetical protein ACFYY8_23845 [Streptosporangium sp. NPDC001559]|uniref:hypothetical protein n=1 Tax=Streptosporangium sp. NPDC001559 TaxID=3366187 RepID=UPI0036EF0795